MRPILSKDIVRSVVSQWTGIPVERIGESEVGDGNLLTLQEKLKSVIFGQEEAIGMLTDALKRRFALSRGSSSARPIANMMFVGPSGTGKTELARQLAIHFFGDARKLIKVNMNDFREPHTASRLVGAPPGYIGYQQGGELTEGIRKEPFSVALFDEVEKAHPEVVTNVLLQMMGEGIITDMSTGAPVDCSNAIVIMTSNLGNRDAGQRGMGFGYSQDTDEEKNYRRAVADALGSFFPPEFMGRIDDVVVFNHLSEEARMKIFQREIGQLEERLSTSGNPPSVKIRIDDLVMQIFLEEANDKQAGARAVQQMFGRRVEKPCSDLKIGGHLEKNRSLEIAVEMDAEGRFVYEVRNAADVASEETQPADMEGI